MPKIEDLKAAKDAYIALKNDFYSQHDDLFRVPPKNVDQQQLVRTKEKLKQQIDLSFEDIQKELQNIKPEDEFDLVSYMEQKHESLAPLRKAFSDIYQEYASLELASEAAKLKDTLHEELNKLLPSTPKELTSERATVYRKTQSLIDDEFKKLGDKPPAKLADVLDKCNEHISNFAQSLGVEIKPKPKFSAKVSGDEKLAAKDDSKPIFLVDQLGASDEKKAGSPKPPTPEELEIRLYKELNDLLTLCKDKSINKMEITEETQKLIDEEFKKLKSTPSLKLIDVVNTCRGHIDNAALKLGVQEIKPKLSVRGSANEAEELLQLNEAMGVTKEIKVSKTSPLSSIVQSAKNLEEAFCKELSGIASRSTKPETEKNAIVDIAQKAIAEQIEGSKESLSLPELAKTCDGYIDTAAIALGVKRVENKPTPPVIPKSPVVDSKTLPTSDTGDKKAEFDQDLEKFLQHFKKELITEGSKLEKTGKLIPENESNLKSDSLRAGYQVIEELIDKYGLIRKDVMGEALSKLQKLLEPPIANLLPKPATPPPLPSSPLEEKDQLEQKTRAIPGGNNLELRCNKQIDELVSKSSKNDKQDKGKTAKEAIRTECNNYRDSQSMTFDTLVGNCNKLIEKAAISLGVQDLKPAAPGTIPLPLAPSGRGPQETKLPQSNQSYALIGRCIPSNAELKTAAERLAAEMGKVRQDSSRSPTLSEEDANNLVKTSSRYNATETHYQRTFRNTISKSLASHENEVKKREHNEIQALGSSPDKKAVEAIKEKNKADLESAAINAASWTKKSNDIESASQVKPS